MEEQLVEFLLNQYHVIQIHVQLIALGILGDIGELALLRVEKEQDMPTELLRSKLRMVD